ncbi:conserved protein of unknown function [Georgfuchsia toluolica]|uniref:DUF1178 family protein n=1 Tax=Georgfuchsia toluolica TaxID=424218 RepID=A0A916J5F1_9PROT|nr:DUF1178 family protein [Georgfuchsia toluolica]CAG4883768.1 conserved protein of unknown function [Georgfuchsia toluolica]
MIILNLQCTKAHPFEGWFDSVEDFDRQANAAMVACPLCGDTQVSRLPSGPRVKSATNVVAEPGRQAMTHMMKALSEMAKNSEDVAERFPEEARRMHYGEAESRNIRGRATLKETRELLEEGIAVLPLPFPAKEEIH